MARTVGLGPECGNISETSDFLRLDFSGLLSVEILVWFRKTAIQNQNMKGIFDRSGSRNLNNGENSLPFCESYAWLSYFVKLVY